MRNLDEPGTPNVTSPRRNSRLASWLVALLILLVLYILSAGPVLALGCWLRDTTDWDGFYAVFWLYLPILYAGWDNDLLEAYLMWWMNLFGTMPPG
jgi:hypothetical protein